jgi:hypothetical protein
MTVGILQIKIEKISEIGKFIDQNVGVDFGLVLQYEKAL